MNNPLNSKGGIKEGLTLIDGDVGQGMSSQVINSWDIIKKQIKRSTIKRYQWKRMLGMSLTEYIHRLRNKGHDKDECIRIIINHPNILKEVEAFPLSAEKMFDNIEISVHARFGENHTADKLRNKEQ